MPNAVSGKIGRATLSLPRGDFSLRSEAETATRSLRSRSPLENAFGVHDTCRAVSFSQRRLMVDRAGTLDSQLAGYDGRSGPRRFKFQYQETDLFREPTRAESVSKVRSDAFPLREPLRHPAAGNPGCRWQRAEESAETPALTGETWSKKPRTPRRQPGILERVSGSIRFLHPVEQRRWHGVVPLEVP